MTVKYYAILTNQGAARLANATMLGSKLNLTQMVALVMQMVCYQHQTLHKQN